MLFLSGKNTSRRDILPKSREKIAFAQLILAFAFLLLAFSSCQIALSNRQLAQRKVTQVQLTDGTAFLVEQKDEYYRSSQLIKTFTQQWVSLLFNWNSQPPDEQNSHSTIQTTEGKKVPVNAWVASMMMEPQFGEQFLNSFADLVPSEVYTGRLQSSAYIRYLSEPRQISPTTWEIDFIATRTLFDSSSKTQKPVIAFNKTLTLKAVTLPTSPLEDHANSFEELVYKMRSSGLEITSVVNYE